MSETTTQPENETTDSEPHAETAATNEASPQSPTPVATPAPIAAAYELPPNGGTGSEIAKYALSVLILAIGVGVAYSLYLLKEAPKDQDSKELITMVDTVTANRYSGELEMTVSGTVVPYREIRVAAEVAGNVAKKYPAFEAGNFVKKGEKLLEIDQTDYLLQLETRKAELEQSSKMLDETKEEIVGAKRSLKLAENEFDLAKTEFERNQRIKNALSSSELDQSNRTKLVAEAAYIARQNTLDMLMAKEKRMEAALALSQANLNRTQLNLDKTTIVAPDDGVIVREMVQEGDYLRAGDAIITFEDTSRSEVICNLTATDIRWVRDNSPASAEFESDPEQESLSVYYLPKTRVSVYEPDSEHIVWDGILERFDGIGRDESTRTIPCRVMIDKPIINTKEGRRALVRGMYVKCKIRVQTSADSSKRQFVSFPAVALRPGEFVWIVKDKKLQRLDVDVVHHTKQLLNDKTVETVVAQVREGSIQPGDQIVETPLSSPYNGLEVILEDEFISKQGEDEGSSVADTSTKEVGEPEKTETVAKKDSETEAG